MIAGILACEILIPLFLSKAKILERGGNFAGGLQIPESKISFIVLLASTR